MESILSYSQSTTAFDGTVYNVGDTIIFGKILRPKIGYLSIKEYNLQTKLYQNLTVDNFWKQALIIDIIKDKKIFNSEDDILVVGKKGLLGFKMFINTKYAILYGEILARYNKTYRVDVVSTEMTDSLSFYANLNYNNIDLDNKIIDEYLREFDKNYKQYSKDEFEYNKVVSEILPKIELKEKEIELGQDYYVFHKATVGEYDFKKNIFPIVYSFGEEVVFGNHYLIGNTNIRKVKFENCNQLTELNIDIDNANKFIKRRKTASGNIDRNIYLKVIFRIIQDKKEKSNGVIYCDIQKIEVYDFEHRIYNLLGIIEVSK